MFEFFQLIRHKINSNYKLSATEPSPSFMIFGVIIITSSLLVFLEITFLNAAPITGKSPNTGTF